MLDWVIRNAIAALLTPPGCLLLMSIAGLLALRRRPRLGWVLIGSSMILLYALSTHFVAHRLLHGLEAQWSDPLAGGAGEAIVVLGSGRYFNAPEFDGDTVTARSLARLRYAARLHRASGKPILVSGGNPEGARRSEAAQMAATLDRDFRVPVAWIEDQSRTTLENARFSGALLKPAGIRVIYLVTDAAHMPRALRAFASTGLAVVPAPTTFTTRFRLTALDFVPDARAMEKSSLWFHEVIGIAWYRIQLAATHQP